ncbi:hypothetical protein [Hymenobacter coccineus]|uniref:PIN domain-containing protein n=1 Tax=Hymenobacter coccineus TaxID=1908235 RepID=A0A1G1TL75_9BACT|nr:hypothetical protein [Hymenobacter coccineus]OGX91591.1 hypothetical protein BEN49_19150 [Hymenobacter coccineus]
MLNKSVLLETSFFIRLLNPSDPLARQAEGYFRYFQQEQYPMLISTVSIAEFCVLGALDQLPLKNLRVLPFNVVHAVRAGEFAAAVFASKGRNLLLNRNIIPNDTKLFAQADSEASIGYYLTSDSESGKVHTLLRQTGQNPRFQFVDLKTPHTEVFGTLGF